MSAASRPGPAQSPSLECPRSSVASGEGGVPGHAVLQRGTGRSLTPRQADCLAFIAAHLAQRPVPPSFQNIADHLGLRSKSGVVRLLDALEERGYVRRTKTRRYSVELCREDPICPHCGYRAGSAACLAEAGKQNAADDSPVAPLATKARRARAGGERTDSGADP